MFSFIIGVCILVYICVKTDIVRYKTCPHNMAMIVYGKTGNSMEPVIITQGGMLIFPFVQEYKFLLLEPMSIDIDTNNENNPSLLTKDSIRINLKANFTFAISKHQYLLQIAAQHLLGMTQKDIMQLAKDIILGEIRLVFATMTLNEIYNKTVEKKELKDSIKIALKNIGMELININIEEITDTSGYKEAQERTEEQTNSFNDEFKQIAQNEIEKEETSSQEIENNTEIFQEFSYNYNECINETVYLEIENAVTKSYEEISLAPNFEIIFPKEVMDKYLNSKKFNEQIKNILIEKTKFIVSSFSYEEIKTNEIGFLKELLYEVNKELNNYNLKVSDIKLLGLFNISEYMETLDKEEQKSQEITETIEPKENIEIQEEHQEEIKQEELQDIQTTLPMNDIQGKIDDIFASTRKYFEKNSNT